MLFVDYCTVSDVKRRLRNFPRILMGNTEELQRTENVHFNSDNWALIIEQMKST
jgi:hypothetical protein